MEKYLLELLKESNTIIIPGLGALTATNKEKGEYMFMPYLKHDDGTLKKFVASKESCDETEARTKIDQFVDTINSKLNNEGTFELANFGVFSKDNSGDIVFDSSISDKETPVVEESAEPFIETKSEAEIVPEIELPKEIEKDDAIVFEEVVQVEAVVENDVFSEIDPNVEENIEQQTSEDDHLEIDQIDDQPEVRSVVIESEPTNETQEEIIVSSDTSVTSVSSNSAEYSEQQQWEDDLDLPPINAKIDRPKKPIIEKAKRDKKRRSPLFYVLILVVVILVGGATTVGVFYNKIKTALFSEERSDTTKLAEGKQFEFTEEADPEPNVESNEASTEVDEIIEEAVETPEVIEEKKLEPPVKKKEVVSGSFFLIVGSFQNEGNANRFSEKMRSEGNDSELIGPNNGFYLVTIGSYSSEADAKSALNEKIQRYPKVWLYKKV
jgi:cell division protein FtsN